ncbi:transmembrane emp24 domain-containing protein 3 isoform X1 [Wyeomyia smithii]|uniref:transmembrane emp24 domain-containing protein 3 isoform X1 n=1 Tax=Wyeomyia smithii TaxID=174621 RepID=UPI002467D4BB|nr:transmembrane emp24 domain-containing protein 3 isoform X1 [Wyeomyia smithii]
MQLCCKILLASGVCLTLLGHWITVYCVELTFELPDNARECFFEEIKKNQTATLEFQVVTGGQYDVDVSLESPTKEILYRQVKTQFDSHQFVAEATGTYVACFSNEFSTFSHKLIYMDFQVGDELPLPGIDEHTTVLTQLETSSQEIHKSLNAILDYQTHHRLREAQDYHSRYTLKEDDTLSWRHSNEDSASLCSRRHLSPNCSNGTSLLSHVQINKSYNSI